MHYTGLVSQSFTKKLLKKKMLCIFLIIKIKHKKKLFFFLSPLTKGQSVRPPNIQINNHLNIVLLVSHFNLTDICHHCCKKKKKKEKQCSHILSLNQSHIFKFNCSSKLSLCFPSLPRPFFPQSLAASQSVQY